MNDDDSKIIIITVGRFMFVHTVHDRKFQIFWKKKYNIINYNITNIHLCERNKVNIILYNNIYFTDNLVLVLPEYPF